MLLKKFGECAVVIRVRIRAGLSCAHRDERWMCVDSTLLVCTRVYDYRQRDMCVSGVVCEGLVWLYVSSLLLLLFGSRKGSVVDKSR